MEVYKVHQTKTTDDPTIEAQHQPRSTSQNDPDYKRLIPNFVWMPSDTIKRTFSVTTQYMRLPESSHLKKHYKSPYTDLNIHRRNKDVATDTIYSDTPAIDSGATSAQLLIGYES